MKRLAKFVAIPAVLAAALLLGASANEAKADVGFSFSVGPGGYSYRSGYSYGYPYSTYYRYPGYRYPGYGYPGPSFNVYRTFPYPSVRPYVYPRPPVYPYYYGVRPYVPYYYW